MVVTRRTVAFSFRRTLFALYDAKVYFVLCPDYRPFGPFHLINITYFFLTDKTLEFQSWSVVPILF